MAGTWPPLGLSRGGGAVRLCAVGCWKPSQVSAVSKRENGERIILGVFLCLSPCLTAVGTYSASVASASPFPLSVVLAYTFVSIGYVNVCMR